MIINISLLIAWVVACLVEGCRDGHFFHSRMNSTKPDNHNIHWLFTVERFIVWCLITYIYFIHHSLFGTGVFSASLIMVFSFFHNSMYYYIRHKLDNNVYSKGWMDSSTTSESFFEFNLIARIFMVIAGLFGITASFTM